MTGFMHDAFQLKSVTESTFSGVKNDMFHQTFELEGDRSVRSEA